MEVWVSNLGPDLCISSATALPSHYAHLRGNPAMLEKIGTAHYQGISAPSADALLVLDNVLGSGCLAPVVAEIGVGVGATTFAIAKRLNGRGKLLLFDFEVSVDELARDLLNEGFSNIEAYGNSRKTYDSYSWNLAQIALKKRREGSGPMLDFAYLDGAHSFVHDAPAAILLKELVKPGGFILFDDLHWTFDRSPTMNPASNAAVRDWYPAAQTAIPHVQMICELFFDNDQAFQRETLDNGISGGRALYRKVLG
ncbi:class I SAM-dependent methyltransferase [Devosia sp. RR2S18]|uniref:class I SAM-dependent methyltransferase n=1 Tax=Devosia rhizosphaerae TaxID=3049774 RepID=UPI002540A517|nr:class I SAM-dependent methyltransferase [Devosia sp. RR2S18]WIJ24026.1 class I SAM-dependent methyltransferase [Devosia sp. RR2S18]